MIQKNFTSLIFLAGGSGSRFGSAIPKQFLPLHGKLLFEYSLSLFRSIQEISEIVVVCDPAYRPLIGEGKFASPGPRRQDSVYNGLLETSPEAEFILIHDAARPFTERAAVLSLIGALKRVGAAALGAPAVNTIKQCTPDRLVEKTLDRSQLWEIQTPQGLRASLLREGFARAEKEQWTVTDDVSLAELLGHPVEIVPSSSRNFKITTPFDWNLACAIN